MSAGPSRGRNARPTATDKRDMLRWYATGLSCSKVAKKVGWSTPIVERTMREAGVMRGKATDAEIAEAIRLKKSGLSLSEITKRVGKTGLTKHLEKAGVHTSIAKFDYDTVKWSDAKRKYQKGASMSVLAKELGAPADVFAKHFKLRFPGIIRSFAQQNRLAAEQKWKLLANRGVTKTYRVRYEQEARQLSSLMFKKWKQVIDPHDLKSKGYHVDHILSVRDACLAFRSPLRLVLVCHPANLQMLTPAANRSKNGRSDVSLSELKRCIRAFEATYGKAI